MTVNAQKEDPVEAILDLTGGSGVDVAVEMAGTREAANQCTASVRHNHPLAFYRSTWPKRKGAVMNSAICRWIN